MIEFRFWNVGDAEKRYRSVRAAGYFCYITTDKLGVRVLINGTREVKSGS